MRVYLVPVAPARYSLYVELAQTAAEAPAAPGEARAGWGARLSERFRATLAEAEAERLRLERGEGDTSSGLWRTIMRRIAEAIAEQRLLWALRHESEVDLHHPADVDGDAALGEVRREFTRDLTRHLRWLVIDGLAAAVTGPVFFVVPGPNVISWYFTFRAIGHFLSWRGARKGLTAIVWRPVASGPLADVRQAISLPRADRRLRLDAIAATLGLKHLTGFVERVAPRTS